MSPTLTLDNSVTAFGRAFLGSQWQIVQDEWKMVIDSADEVAVHTMRKAIRRSFTIMKLFAPYFVGEELPAFRRHLRKLMKRLGRSRDLTIFLINLNETFPQQTALFTYFQNEKAISDNKLQKYAAKVAAKAWPAQYTQFLAESSLDKITTMREEMPALIQQHIQAVMAFKPNIPQMTPEELHKLRIQFKELRYSLEFFQERLKFDPLIVLAPLKQIQDILGALNDAVVARQLLLEISLPGATEYDNYLIEEIKQYQLNMPAAWAAFDTSQWHQTLEEIWND